MSAQTVEYPKHPGSTATGTVLWPGTVCGYVTQAGYTRVDTLPIEHDPWRVCHLHA